MRWLVARVAVVLAIAGLVACGTGPDDYAVIAVEISSGSSTGVATVGYGVCSPPPDELTVTLQTPLLVELKARGEGPTKSGCDGAQAQAQVPFTLDAALGDRQVRSAGSDRPVAILLP